MNDRDQLRLFINKVQKKTNSLKYPKGYSCRPVLIHVNGVSQTVKESELFSQIIDFSDFFKKEKF